MDASQVYGAAYLLGDRVTPVAIVGGASVSAAMIVAAGQYQLNGMSLAAIYTLSGGASDLDIVLETSPDNSTWLTLLTIPTKSASGEVATTVAGAMQRYVRLNLDGGAGPGTWVGQVAIVGPSVRLIEA